jgi:predicted hydrocarbon binding protein
MASKVVQIKNAEDSFWREFPTMADYFAPGIVPILNYLGLGSKQVMHEFGEMVGRKAAAGMADLSLDEMLAAFSKIWQDSRIGSLAIEKGDPLVIQLSDCTVCGQLQGTGVMFECSFHEGFFQGALEARLGKPVTVSQVTNNQGDAGTWCRRLAIQVSK